LLKYRHWPKLNWGLVVGCNLVKFQSEKGIFLQEKGRLFTILVSVAWQQIWNLRVNRGIMNPEAATHNQWLKANNDALRRDRLLTDKVRFRPLAFKKQLVLNTWSGLLMHEESFPDDWTYEGVLVGMRPMINKLGIG